MHIEHFEKGLRYTDRELLIVAQKVGKLARYCARCKNEESCIRIEAERRDTQKKADCIKVLLTVYLPQKTLHAESRQGNVLDAIDRCIDKLKPQIDRYKEKGKTRRGLAR